MSFNKYVIITTFKILDEYQVTSQDIQERFPEIQDKEGIILTRDEKEYLTEEFYAGISEDIEKGVFNVREK